MERKTNHIIGEVVCIVIDVVCAIIAIIERTKINSIRVALPILILYVGVGLISILSEMSYREKPTVKTIGFLILGVILFFCFK